MWLECLNLNLQAAGSSGLPEALGTPGPQLLLMVTATVRTSFPSGMMVTV